METSFVGNPLPPVNSGIPPAPGLPPARFAGWSANPDVRSTPVPYPTIQHGDCCDDFMNICNPGPGKCVVPAVQPIIPVPVHQQIIRKDKIIEVPQLVVLDKIQPKLWTKDVTHEVADLSLQFTERTVKIPRHKLVLKEVEIPVPVGYNFKVIPKWQIREVPKIIPKYVGIQEVIEIDVPQVKIVDVFVEKEVPVYVGEKIVEKEEYEYEDEEIEELKYVEQEEEVPIYKYKPVFDVEVDIPPPLVVPVPVQPESISAETERISYAEYKRLQAAAKKCCGDQCVSCS